MKTQATILIIAASVLLVAGQGICQQRLQIPPPTEETIIGEIKEIIDGKILVVSPDKGSSTTEDISIPLSELTRDTMGKNAPRLSDIRVGQTVRVTYKTESVIPIVDNVATGVKTWRTWKSLSIISAGSSRYSLPCERECDRMFRRGELKQGITLEECFKILCK